MTRPASRLVALWLVAVFTVTLVATDQPAPTQAYSYDATKINAGFLAEVLANPGADYDVIVRGSADSTKDRVQKASKAVWNNGGKLKFGLGIVGGAAGTVKGERVLNLTRDGDADFVFKDERLRTHFDPVAGAASVSTAGILAINAPAVWSTLGLTGSGVTVAVLDSGVYPHPDLAGRILGSIDFTSATPTFCLCAGTDPGGHGTHVAGLIAGDGTSSGGAYTGVAPRAKIVDVRVIDANGNSNTSILLRGMQWVLGNRNTYGIRVVNMSLGATPSSSYKSDALATGAEVLRFAGLAVVVSAGNSGPYATTITTPATDPFVITVGAVDDAGTASLSDDSIATFSSRGATAFDGLSKPDVVAPGRRMVSLRSPGSTLDTLFPTRQVSATGELTPSYFMMSGTSMAAPVVAGTVALLLERNNALTPAKIGRVLKNSATPLPLVSPLDQGAGMINALAAVSSVDPGTVLNPSRPSDSFAKDMYKFVFGQPIVWKDLLFHGGGDSKGVPWSNITWDNITWDNITWDAFTWTSITWENVTWENITWESTSALSAGSLSSRGAGWDLVD